MRIFLKIFILLISLDLHAICDFKKEITKVISLSGTSTVILKELGLLKNPKLKGVSVFNPIEDSDFQGKIYPGGIFLSHQSMEELDQGFVLYDESRELRRIFESRPSIKAREIKTRNLTPNQAIETTISAINKLIQDCGNEVERLNKKINEIQKSLLKLLPSKRFVVFYLGDFIGGRRPQMVMANDGVVKWLVKENKIKTYPSELAYVNWSSKILNDLSPQTIHIGLIDSGRNGEKKIKKSPAGVTLIYPGSLVPGLSQLEAFLFLFQKL